jgi:hypothetical protein
MPDKQVQERAAVRLQLQGSILVSVENFRRSQPKIPSRSEAIRQLLDRALGEPERPAKSAATQE